MGEMHPEELTSTQPESASKTLFLSRGCTLANRYEVRDLLGYGGMSEVWLAYDLKLRIEVALKAMRPEKFPAEKGREILRREVRNAREVISPNVCRVFDLFESDGVELVSMEYVHGITLQQVLFDRGPLELREAQEIASQFLAGLEEIHRAGLVHRDVKPSNIMVTRTGRVVVMDFGLASGIEETPAKISGTPAYMPPEYSECGRIDALTDVFSAGMVLAEMVNPDGIRDELARRALWDGIRGDPPRTPATPWSAVVRKAVAHDPEARYASAGELLRALEEVRLRVAGADHLNPYPGLAAFTEDDADYFFGREAEIEQIWRKLDQPRLQALVGPSGVGKSSFLRAGIMAMAPPGWRIVLATPGTQPFASLTRALSHMREPSEHDPLAIVAQLRRDHEHVLVIVDQFEELFTLNPREVQDQFAVVLSRLALKSDVSVLLSMRDDFLFHCQRFDALSPMFSDLTALGPPTGAALRRALVQPALRCGYRLEDELLVDQILGEVEGERGALPLMAFAMSQLWHKRDREQGLLTRQAYEEIGGVAGALAQHAEATMERIGTERIAIVRELSRNLVTAQGTRAARDRRDLLSVFPQQDGKKVTGVLDSLVAARLFTSYEVNDFDVTAGEPERQRIEIVHESLLTKWPRLVRWQTQDAEGAQFRDELRQAANLWHQHDRSEDFLWTGMAYQEYQLWRARYTGGLTPLEEAFAEAATTLAGRKRTRRRIAVAAVLTLAVVIAAVTFSLWQKAERDAHRAEAAELLALGRLRLQENPTTALAYALASLERADSAAARRFAVETLWQGGAAFVVPVEVESVEFSPDGRWLVTGGVSGGIRLWSRDGGPSKYVAQPQGVPRVSFGPASNRLVVNNDRTLRVLSLPDARELRRVDFDAHVWVERRRTRLLTVTAQPQNAQTVQSWPVDGGKPELLGRWDLTGVSNAAISGSGQWLAEARERVLSVRPLENLSSPSRVVGTHRANITGLLFDTDHDRLVSVDETGELRIWPTQTREAYRTMQSEGGMKALEMSADGSMLAATRGVLSTSHVASVWDLNGPPDADPRVLRNGDVKVVHSMSIDGDGRWLAAALNDFAILWPLRQSVPRVFRGQGAPWIQVAFTPDGKWLASSSQANGTVRLWPLSPAAGAKYRILLQEKAGIQGLAIDPSGRNLLASVWGAGRALLVPLDGGAVRTLPRSARGVLERPAFSADGLAAASTRLGPNDNVIELWDLRSGKSRVLNARVGNETGVLSKGFEGVVWEVEFTSNGHLVSAGVTGLRLWNLAGGTSTLLKPSRTSTMSFLAGSPVDRFLLSEVDMTKRTSTVTFYDLRNKTPRELTSHGNRVQAVALDRTGTIAVTGDFDGVVRVGPVTGEEPHLLYGHRGEVTSVAVSPDGRWITSGSQDGTIRMWPMPDVSKPPLHALPYQQVLAKLRSLTNLRVVKDSMSATGYKVEMAAFPGWKNMPGW